MDKLPSLMSADKISPNFLKALFLCILVSVISIFLSIVLVFLFYLDYIKEDVVLRRASMIKNILISLLLLSPLLRQQLDFRFSEIRTIKLKEISFVSLYGLGCAFLFAICLRIFSGFIHVDGYKILSFSEADSYDLLQCLFVVPVVSELIFRRVLLCQFLKIYPVWVAIVLSSFLFALFVTPVIQVPVLLIPFFLLGVSLGCLFYRTGSLLMCIWVYFIMNLSVFVSVGKYSICSVFTAMSIAAF